MNLKFRLITVLAVLNFLLSIVLGFWMYNKTAEPLSTQKLEYLLGELAEKNPQFLVSLLNNSANISSQNDTELLEDSIFKNRSAILKSGFYIKKHPSDLQKTLVVFSDMTCPHCVAFLKNVEVALNKVNCSVVIIPISMLGEKSTYQAKIITAASLQNAKKAFKLELTYKAFEGAENDVMKCAEKIGLDVVMLTQATESVPVVEAVTQQTKLAEDLRIPGVPSIFLVTSECAYLIPPVEAKDLPEIIDNLLQKEI